LEVFTLKNITLVLLDFLGELGVKFFLKESREMMRVVGE
jgi:hypothetical protein